MILFTIQCYLFLNCKRCFECDAMLFLSFFVTRNVYLYEEKHFVIHSAKIAVSKYVNVGSKKNWNNCHAQMMDYLGAVVFAEVHNSECWHFTMKCIIFFFSNQRILYWGDVVCEKELNNHGLNRWVFINLWIKEYHDLGGLFWNISHFS